MKTKEIEILGDKIKNSERTKEELRNNISEQQRLIEDKNE